MQQEETKVAFPVLCLEILARLPGPLGAFSTFHVTMEIQQHSGC